VQTSTVALTKVEHNTKIDDALFSKPRRRSERETEEE